MGVADRVGKQRVEIPVGLGVVVGEMEGKTCIQGEDAPGFDGQIHTGPRAEPEGLIGAVELGAANSAFVCFISVLSTDYSLVSG